MTLFLSFNRFLSRVESWNGWHMLIFPRRHAATFSNDFGWNINAILRKLRIHHSLFFCSRSHIFGINSQKAMNPFCVLFVLYLSKTLPHTSLTNKHTHMKICKHTHCHTCSSAHKEVKTPKKSTTHILFSELPASHGECLYFNHRSRMEPQTPALISPHSA